jgi:hypothetical protein
MSTVLLNTLRFVILLFLQIIIFNNIDLFGYVNPYPYVLFILLFPVNGNKYSLLLTSFLLGLLLDIFCNSGGIHTGSSIILAALRPNFFKFSFGLSYEYQTVKIADRISTERISFLLLSILTHHLILFSLEYFRINLFFTIISRVLITTVFTFAISVLIIYLIKPSKR